MLIGKPINVPLNFPDLHHNLNTRELSLEGSIPKVLQEVVENEGISGIEK